MAVLDLLVPYDPGHSQTEVGAKHVDKNCVSGVPGAEVLTPDDLIDIEKDNLDHGHHNEHEGAGRANDHTERDEDTGAGKVSTDKGDQVNVNPGSARVTQFVVNKLNLIFRRIKTLVKFYLFSCLSPLDPSDRLLVAFVVVEMEEARDQNLPLDAERRHKKVERHSREAVLFQEGHQEAETHKDHHVNILEAFKGMLISISL